MAGLELWALNFDGKGWFSLPVSGLGVVYYKATELDGRWRITEMYIDGEGRSIQAAALRGLPLAVLEEQAQFWGDRPSFDDLPPESGPDLRGLLSALAPENAIWWMPDESGRLKRREGGIPRAPLEPVTLDYDPAEGLTDDFLRRVAGVYSWAVRERKPPAKEIAEQASVNQRTAQSWIYKARKRGVMPPAPHRGRIA